MDSKGRSRRHRHHECNCEEIYPLLMKGISSLSEQSNNPCKMQNQVKTINGTYKMVSELFEMGGIGMSGVATLAMRKTIPCSSSKTM